MDKLQEELRKLARTLDIDLFGVADLTTARDFTRLQGGEHIGRYPQAISLGMRLLDAIVDELYRHEEPLVIHTFRWNAILYYLAEA